MFIDRVAPGKLHLYLVRPRMRETLEYLIYLHKAFDPFKNLWSETITTSYFRITEWRDLNLEFYSDYKDIIYLVFLFLPGAERLIDQVVLLINIFMRDFS